jgi:hypothetical protein
MVKHAWIVVWQGLKAAFDLMPDFVALFLTAIGIAAVAMGENIKRLDDYPKWRRSIIIACITFGCLAFISNQIQKGQDKADRAELSRQVKNLADGSANEATSADIHGLSDAISIGFQRLEKAISGSKQVIQIPAKPSIPPAAVPTNAPQSIRFTQKRVPSTDPQNYPYALQIIVQSDVSVTPVGLAFIFTGPISSINFFLAGQPVMMMTQSGVLPENPKVGIVRVGYPALSPDTPLVVTVLSKENVNLMSIEKISAAMGGPINIP